MKNLRHTFSIHTTSLLLVMGLVFSFSSVAQQRIQGSLYNINGYSLNTAYAGLNKCTEGFLGHKSQWLGVDGAPTNTYLQVHSGLGENFGIGGGVFRWNNGLLTNYDFSVALAHHLNLNENLKFSYSANLGYYLSQFESADVIAFDQDIHTNQERLNDGGLYTDFGMLLSHEKFEFGIALPRIVNSNLEFAGDNATSAFENERYLNIHGNYKYDLNEDITLVPAVAYRTIPTHNGVFDLLAGAVYKDMFGVNVGFRTRNGLIASAHYIHNDLITIGYAYDAGMANLNGISKGSHEVVLSIKICKQKKEKAEKEPEPTPEPTPVKEYFLTGVVSNAKTGNSMPFQSFDLVNDSTGEKTTVTADSAGAFKAPIQPDAEYTVQKDAPNYNKFKSAFKTDNLSDDKELNLAFVPKVASYYGVVSDAGSKAPLEGVTVELKNANESYSAVTDKDGKFSMELNDKKLNDPLNYEATFSKKGFAKEKHPLSSSVKSFDPMDLMEELEAEIALQSFDHGADIAKIIDLKPIYFDLGKTEITPTAEIELNKIIEIMNENPDMHILIGSHTDCRGSDALNSKLSDQRAKASADYIKAKITTPSRIEGKGFGESKPVTDCNCNACSEEQHKLNRRTTFEIVKEHK